MNFNGHFCQDLFAYTVLGNKENGYWFDVGARDFPGGSFGNNNMVTLHREYGWRGISVDILDYASNYTGLKDVVFVQADATEPGRLNNILQDNSAPKVIDFLSFDIDPAAWRGFEQLDLDTYKFRTMCIEHDNYIYGDAMRDAIREKVLSYGYYLAAELYNCEDWWIHPDFISVESVKHLKKINDIKPANAAFYLHQSEMVDIILQK